GIPQFGLVAEDVEKVNPDLVARDEEGKPYTVRYEEVNAMLSTSFSKSIAKFRNWRRTPHTSKSKLKRSLRVSKRLALSLN
ncbi:MAG: hypothetical protein DME56_08865, partial [Verrucomicrobia bacterium]